MSDPTEGIGCDDLASLAKAETAYFRRRALQLANHGVRVVDLDSIQIHANVTVEPGAVIGPGAIIGGRTHIKTRARVGEGSQISDSSIAEGSTVISSRITDSRIGADARIGPNAFVRDGTRVWSGRPGRKLRRSKKLGHRSRGADRPLLLPGRLRIGGRGNRRRRDRYLQLRPGPINIEP